MEFEHVTFDLPHGTFHALQGGDPDGQPTIVLHGFPDHPRPLSPSLPNSAAVDVTSSHPGFAVTRRPRLLGRSTSLPSPAT